MGKRQTYRRRSRKRPTRKAQNHRRKTQNRANRRRQRGGVSDNIVTNNHIDGIPVSYDDTVVSTPTGTMGLNAYRERREKADDPSLD